MDLFLANGPRHTKCDGEKSGGIEGFGWEDTSQHHGQKCSRRHSGEKVSHPKYTYMLEVRDEDLADFLSTVGGGLEE